MPPPDTTPQHKPAQSEAHRRERRSHIRGLLILAALVLLWILFRVDRTAIFHRGWWRL